MSTKKPATASQPFAGATNFGDTADYIAPPPREVREAARTGGEAIGFVSDKRERGAKPEPAQAVTKRTRPASQYPDHYNLRLRIGDRERFDDYAYRHRIPKGEVMRRLLDLAEAEEARQAGRRAPEKGSTND